MIVHQPCNCPICHHPPAPPLPPPQPPPSASSSLLKFLLPFKKPLPFSILDTYFFTRDKVTTSVGQGRVRNEEVGLRRVFGMLEARRVGLCREQMVVGYQREHPEFIVSEFDMGSIVLLNRI
jgi:hypothetical protein